MTPMPPRTPCRILAYVLRNHQAGRAILGDLQEAFVERHDRRGAVRAHLWYWFEALTLSASMMTRNALQALRRDDGKGRNMSGFGGIRGMIQDARYALRKVRRDPAFFAIAALIIGIGVGASTAVYSVMKPLLLSPLPFANSDRLVWVQNVDESGSGGTSGVTHRANKLRDFRELSRSFDGLTGYFAFFVDDTYNLDMDGPVRQLQATSIAHDFLGVLGVEPRLGRGFTEAEGRWGGPDVVILAHDLWQQHFGGDPGVVGSTIRVNGTGYQVVGVLPASFDFSSVFSPGTSVDLLFPYPIGDETDAWGNTMYFVGRLAPGATVASAQSELDEINRRLQEAEPDRWGLGAEVMGLQEHVAGPVRPALILLAAAAVAVLLIVCVNLSNMLLARGPRRAREVAIRRTMGATRGRMIRQLVLETLMVALAGAGVGLVVAWIVTGFVSGTSGVEIPLLRDVGVDASAMAFSVALALVAGLLVGVLPALRVSEGGDAAAMRSGRGAAGGGGTRLREMLVVAEVAMACVLLVFGGLFLRSFQQVLDVELGFEPEGVVAWQLTPSRQFETNREAVAFFSQFTEEVRAIPGVRSAGLIDGVPLQGNRSWGFRVVGFEYTEENEGHSLFPHVIAPGYLETMGVDIVAGRGLTANDDGPSEQVVLINRTAAEELWPGQDPTGWEVDTWTPETWRIVGVVEDVKHRALEEGSGYQIYFPMAQMPDFRTVSLVVRSEVAPEAITGLVSAALSRIDPGMATDEFVTMADLVDRSVSPRRFTLLLLASFAGAALFLAAVGIYGVLSYSVSERLPEIGIRMALGATSAEVQRQVVGRTVVLAVVGIVLGLGVALSGSGVITSLLFGVEPADPMTLGGMSAVLLAVAAVAGLLPALRAGLTDVVGVLKGL